jgi:hypothetical protein
MFTFNPELIKSVCPFKKECSAQGNKEKCICKLKLDWLKEKYPVEDITQ